MNTRLGAARRGLAWHGLEYFEMTRRRLLKCLGLAPIAAPIVAIMPQWTAITPPSVIDGTLRQAMARIAEYRDSTRA